MATLRGKSWQGVVYHPQLAGGRARRNFDSKAEAERWEIDTRAAAQNGQPVDMGDSARKRAPGKPYTLGELCEYAIKHHWDGVKSGSDASFNARQVTAAIGPNMPIHKVGRVEIDRARAAVLATGNSKATCNRKMAALSKMLAIALDLEVIDRPIRTPKYKESEPRVRRFTPAEERLAAAFFARTGNQDMADLVVVLLDTGLRMGEALDLTGENVVDGKVQVWGRGLDAEAKGSKSGKSRTVPLTGRARGVLEARGGGRGVRLFPLTRHMVDHHWTRLRDTLELTDDPHFVPHILRHEFCSRLADRGAAAPVIQRLAGHSSLTVTQRYIHINGDALRAAIEGLETDFAAPHASSPRGDFVAHHTPQ